MNFKNSFKDTIKVLVKPNSNTNEIIGFDEERKLYRVTIKAPAEKGKANKELIKFFSKLTKRQVRIVSGFSSREKILKFD